MKPRKQTNAMRAHKCMHKLRREIGRHKHIPAVQDLFVLVVCGLGQRSEHALHYPPMWHADTVSTFLSDLLRDRDNWGTTVCEHSDTVASFAEASALALLHGSPQAQHNAILIAHPLGATTLCRAGGAVGLAMRSRLIETVEFLRDTTNAETS